MKISREWLQTYFEKPLPDVNVLAQALTFHAFEIEGIGTPDAGGEWDILDVKVTPNRGHDCLSHRGIAKELSAILNVPMKGDPLRLEVSLTPTTNKVSVSIGETQLCPRYIAGLIRGVKVGPSPHWLRNFLESIGQKSINNIVDAANFVMFSLGQPLHAFDAGQLSKKESYAIGVRRAKVGEKLLALDEKEYVLAENMLVITHRHADAAIGIAGVKGGKPTGISETTTDTIIESANFDGVSTRKSASALKLRTDASSRYEQVISPDLCAYGMRAVADLILELAGGEIAGFVDEYPTKQERTAVSATTASINGILGSALTDADVGNALQRLDLRFTRSDDVFVVEPPFERLDLTIPEDIAEEVGRIVGYDTIKPSELPPLSKKPEINPDFFAAERAREDLIAKGYSEVCTSVFAEKGERVVANKVDGVKPYLRATLVDGLTDALERNRRIKDILGLNDVKLFEIGAVWKGGKETTMLGTADEKGVREELLEKVYRGDASVQQGYEELPLSTAERYQPFSKYPFIVRDISLWAPKGTEREEIMLIIEKNAGELLVGRPLFFDSYEPKGGDKISYAFRLIFQSLDKTLTDFDANERMESISAALTAKGFEIR